MIYNPCAGGLRGRRAGGVERARAALSRYGYQVQAVPTSGPGMAGDLARQAVAGGADLVLALGGDGTINEVASGMAGSAAPLGVLPAGTANVLARELGLGCNLARAVALIPKCVPRRVRMALLRAEGTQPRPFLLMAGAGFDAHIVYRLSLPLKSRVGQLAYWLSAAKQFARRLEEFDAIVDGQRFRCSFALASRVRNYGGHFEIARGASLLADDFEVALFEGRAVVPHYVRYFAAVVSGSASKAKGIKFLRGRTVRFEAPSDSRVYVQVDGEYAGRLPASVEIAPDALTLLVPPEFR